MSYRISLLLIRDSGVYLSLKHKLYHHSWRSEGIWRLFPIPHTFGPLGARKVRYIPMVTWGASAHRDTPWIRHRVRAARACHSALSHGGIRHCKGCPHRQHPRPRRRVSRPRTWRNLSGFSRSCRVCNSLWNHYRNDVHIWMYIIYILCGSLMFNIQYVLSMYLIYSSRSMWMHWGAINKGHRVSCFGRVGWYSVYVFHTLRYRTQC